MDLKATRALKRLVFIAALLVVSMLSHPALSLAATFDIKVVESPKGLTAWLLENADNSVVTLKFSFPGGWRMMANCQGSPKPWRPL